MQIFVICQASISNLALLKTQITEVTLYAESPADVLQDAMYASHVMHSMLTQ